MMTAEPVLTSSPETFMKALAPGDLLLFDSLGFEAGLVQWADNAPVNHVSLVLDQDRLIEANKTHDNPTAPAVRTIPMVGRLTYEDVRMVTALRHEAVDLGVRDARAALEEARRQEGKGDFAYTDLAALAPWALRRSYGHLGKPDRILHTAVKLAMDTFHRANSRPGSDGGQVSVSCSEFVYLCYAKAGLDPLTPPPTPAVVTANEVTVPVVVADAGQLGHPSSAVADQHLAAEAAAGAAIGEWAETSWRAQAAQVTAAVGGPPGLHDRVVADCVTPGDLWGSDRLVLVATLCKPPLRWSKSSRWSSYGGGREIIEVEP
jgi:hypothetical protein